MESKSIKSARIGARAKIYVGVLALTGVIVVALINNWFGVSKGPTSKAVVQTAGIGNNENAGRDNIHSGKDNIQAGHDVTINNTSNYFADSSKQNRRSGSRITYSITSTNQHGGITAANVLQLTNATIILQAPYEVKDDSVSGYLFEIDTVKKIIRVQPRTGRWDNPFIGLEPEEKDAIDPHVQMQNRTNLVTSSGSYSIGKQRLFGLVGNIASTPQLYYSFHYNEPPSTVVFGNYPNGPLFNVSLRHEVLLSPKVH